jgi:hypothetical protein
MFRPRVRTGRGSGIQKLLAIGYTQNQLIAIGYNPLFLERMNSPELRRSPFDDDLPTISKPMKLPGIDDPVGLVALMHQLGIDDCPPELLSRALPQSQISDFPRKITVEAGLLIFCSTISPIKSSKSRFWIPSSFKTIQSSFFLHYEPLRLMTFEIGSQLESIEPKAFWNSKLPMIVIPASVKVLCTSCFQFCELRFVRLECESRLERIEENAFHRPFSI